MKTQYPVQWAAGLASTLFPYLIKQDPKKIILTSFHCDGYRGNTRLIFEELCKHSVFKPVWLSRNPDLINSLKKTFGENHAELAHSIDGLKSLASASALLFTHGTSDYPFLRLPRRSMRIQTYHGLPTKRGEYLRPNSEKPPGFFHKLILKYRFQPINYFLSSSPFVTEIFSQRFNLSKESFIECGYPSYDPLINANLDNRFIQTIYPEAPEYKSVVLYSPTYRKLSKTKWFPFDDFDRRELGDYLEKYKILLLLRPHPNEDFGFDTFGSISERILYAGDKIIEDAYQILIHTNVIITDYSSIYLEGLLRNIPSIFIPYDLDNYERGFPYPYDEFTPGEKVNSMEGFFSSLNSAINNKDYYTDERLKIRDLFFSRVDGKSTERVIRFLENQLL